MYWKQGTYQTAAANLPFYITGTNFDATFTLVTEAGEDLTGVALLVSNADYEGYISAKRATDSEYLEIMGLGNPLCFLGDFATATETDIDFRVSLPSTLADGLIIISVVTAQNQTPPGAWPLGWSTLWGEGWPELWPEDWPSN